MKTYFFKVFFSILCITNACFCEELISISVVIPCESSHIRFLPKLLDSLKNQSYTPSEVVVSISNSKSEYNHQIAQLQKEEFPFLLKIIRSSKRQFAGENRNIAISKSKGDLIICQDADDLPHKQRIESIKNVFQETNFDYLIHQNLMLLNSEHMIEQYMESFNAIEYPQDNFDLLSLNESTDLFQIEKLHPELFSKFIPDGSILSEHNIGIHMGNCAFKRSLFDQAQFNNKPSAQDFDFFIDVSQKFNNLVLLHQPLICYLRDRSTLNIRMKND